MRTHFRPVVTALLVLSLAGCSKGRLVFLERFSPDRGVVERPAPQAAVYKIKVARSGAPKGDLHTLGGSRRFLRAGDAVGFRTEKDGRVVAVAGHETFPLRRLPRDIFYVWAYRPEPIDRDEQGRRVESFLGSVWNVTLVGGLIGLLVWTFPAWLFPSDDRDEEDGHR